VAFVKPAADCGWPKTQTYPWNASNSRKIKLGTRSVLEYFFSPISKAFQEAGRER